MVSIVQKRYRFNLDLNDPAQRSLNEYLELLDSMTVKERGAWLSRALSFYHDAVISGAVEPSSQSEAHQNLMAQTLAYKSEYFPANPIGNNGNQLLASLTATASAARTQSPSTNTAAQPEFTSHALRPNQGEPIRVSQSQLQTTPQTTTDHPGFEKDTPLKRKLGAVM
jgi:CCR4-NOT transcriptional regulation complex NOT5 subunit